MGGLCLMLLCVMEYALFEARHAAPSPERQESKETAVIAAEDDIQGFSTSSVMYASSTLGIQLTIPTTNGLFLWKQLPSSTSTIQRLRIIERQSVGGAIACVTEVALVPGPLTALRASTSFDGDAYQIAGNESLHLEATQKNLCQVRAVFQVGAALQAVYRTRAKEPTKVPQSNEDTCTDYALEAPREERGGAVTSTLVESVIDHPLVGGHEFRIDGACMPFSVRLAQVPSSNRIVLFLRTVPPSSADGLPSEDTPGFFLRSSPGEVTYFSGPGIFDYAISPDQRYLAEVNEHLIGQDIRQEVGVQDLRTGKGVAGHSPVLLGRGRNVFSSQPSSSWHGSAIHWTGARTFQVLTGESGAWDNPVKMKTLTVSF